MLIRPEGESDRTSIYRVNQLAFETHGEAELIDALRKLVQPMISLVAEDAGAIVGHILFSPVSLTGGPGLKMMGLGPMAVMPKVQRQGIGSALVRAGLERCRVQAISGVVVLGHPRFYPRFGFVEAASLGLVCEFDAPSEAFMALELEPGAFEGKAGTVTYPEAFGRV